MTAPTLMPATPAVSTSGRGASPAATGPTGAGFASALDDALTGGNSAGRQPADAPGLADPDADAAAEQADAHPTTRTGPRRGGPHDTASDEADGSAAAPTVVQPGLWALLSAIQPLPGATPGAGSAATSAAGLITAATSTAGPAAAPGAPGALGATAPDAPSLGATALGATALGATALGATGLGATGLGTQAGPPVPGAPGPVADDAPAAPVAATRPVDVLTDPSAAALSVVLGAPTGPSDAASQATAGSTDAAPGAPAVTSPFQRGGAGDTDASGSSPDDPSSERAGAGAAPSTPLGADGAGFSLALAPATAPVSPATGSTPATADTPVAAQLGQQLAVLTDAPDGSQTMTLVISPDELGPVSIQATVTDGQLDLTLHGAHEHGRHALAEALPELRRELESVGLSVQRLEVSTGSGSGGDADPWARAAQQQLTDAQGGQQRRPTDTGRGTATASGDHQGEGITASASDLSTSSGVDVRV